MFCTKRKNLILMFCAKQKKPNSDVLCKTEKLILMFCIEQKTNSDVLHKTKKPNSDVLRKTKKNLILMFCAKQNYSMGLFNVLPSKV
jgi:hypothetical protein